MALIDEVDSLYATEEQPTESSTTNEDQPTVEITSVKDDSGNKWGGFLDSLYEEEQPSESAPREDPKVAIGMPFAVTPTSDISMGEMAHNYETGEKLDRGEEDPPNAGWWSDVKKGYMRGESGISHFLSNVAMVLEKFTRRNGVTGYNPATAGLVALREFGDKVNESAGGSDNLLGSLSNYFKNYAEATEPKQEENTSLTSALIQGAAELPAVLSTYLLGTALMGGNAAAGMALVDGMKEADKGVQATILGAIKGGMLGRILHATSIFNKPLRVGMMGGIFGGMTAAEGGSQTDVAASTLLGGALAVPGGGGKGLSLREGIREANKKFEPIGDRSNPMVDMRFEDRQAEIDQMGERGRVYPPEETGGREGYVAPTSELWAQLGGREEAIGSTYDYLKRQGFSQERVSEIMDMLYPGIEWKTDVVLVNRNVVEPKLIKAPTADEVALSQINRDESLPENKQGEPNRIIQPNQKEVDLIGEGKKPLMGPREEEVNEKTTNVIQNTTDNKPGEVVGVKAEDDVRMQELSRKDPTQWTAEDRAFYNRYMDERESRLITGKEEKPGEIVKLNESEIKNYGKSTGTDQEMKMGQEDTVPVPVPDTGLKNLREASIDNPMGQKRLAKALWDNLHRIEDEGKRKEIAQILMKAEMEQDLGKAGTLLEEAAQRLHRDTPLLRNTMVEEMSEGKKPSGGSVTLGSDPWQSLYERFFPETKRTKGNIDEVKGIEEARERGYVVEIGTINDDQGRQVKGNYYEVLDLDRYVIARVSNKAEALKAINKDLSAKDVLVVNTGFYSKLGEVVSQKVGKRIPVDQLSKLLENSGVKKQEMKWSGMNDFIETFKGQTVTKAQIVNYLKEHELLFNDLEIENPKFERYIRGGGTNYKERLITFNYPKSVEEYKINSLEEAKELGYQIIKNPGGEEIVIKNPIGRDIPKIYYRTEADMLKAIREDYGDIAKTKDYEKGHWSGEEGAVNVIGSMITRDDVSPDGKKVLGIREIQSDWDLSARKNGGYGIIDSIEEAKKRGFTWNVDGHDVHIKLRGEKYSDINVINPSKIRIEEGIVKNINSRAVPDTLPFRDKWYEVVLKRAIKYAIDNGYDYISWSTGQQVAEQYHLNKYVDKINHWDISDEPNLKDVRLKAKDGIDIKLKVNKETGVIESANPSSLFEKDFGEVVGKELAKKILSKPAGEVTGLDMVITPEGKDALYEIMIPSFVNKFAGKRGGKLGEIDIGGKNIDNQPISDNLNKEIKSLAEDMDIIEILDDWIPDDESNLTFKNAKNILDYIADFDEDYRHDQNIPIERIEALQKRLENEIPISSRFELINALKKLDDKYSDLDPKLAGEDQLSYFDQEDWSGIKENLEEISLDFIPSPGKHNKATHARYKALGEELEEIIGRITDSEDTIVKGKVGEDLLKEFTNDQTTKDMLENGEGYLYSLTTDEPLELVKEAMDRGYFKNEEEVKQLSGYLEDNIEELSGDKKYSKSVKQMKAWKDELNSLTFPTGDLQPGLEITPELKKSINEEGMPLYSGLDPSRIINLFKSKSTKNPQVGEKAGHTFNRMIEFFSPGLTVPGSKDWFYARQAAKGSVGEGEYIADQFSKLYKDIKSEDRLTLWNFMNGTTELSSLPDYLKVVGKELRSLDNKLGKMLVNAGIMSEETFDQMKDRHIRYIYNTNMTGENLVAGSQSGAKIPWKAFKERKELSDLEMDRLGLIRDPIKALSQSIIEVHKAVGMKEYFSKIADNKEWIYAPSVFEFDGKKMGIGKAKEMIKTISAIEKSHPDWINAEQLDFRNRLKEAVATKEKAMGTPSGEFIQLNGAHYGDLDGAYVNRTIANDIKPIFSMAQKFDSELLRKTNYVLDTATGLWKLKSVALNPPTAARNCISNTIQMWMSGMPLYRMPGYFVKAAESVKSKNDIYLRAMKQGLFKGNWSASELNDILDIAKAEGKGLGKLLQMGRDLGKYYGKIDDFFKVAKFVEGISKGLGDAEAARLANKWGMDYSLAHPSVKYIRSTPLGAPFITYQYKVLPLIAEAMMKRPWVPISLIALPYLLQKQVTKNLSEEDAKKYMKSLPEYVKNGQVFLIPGPNGMNALDISYLVPWGNWWQIATETAKGEVSKATRETGLAGGLIPSLLYAIKTNKDLFTGEDIISPLDKQTAKGTALAMTKYIWNQSMPPMLSTYGVVGKTIEHLKHGKTKTGTETSGLNVYPRLAGVNIYPVDPRSGMMQRKRDIREVQKALYKKMMDRTLSDDERKELVQIYRYSLEKFNK